MLESRMKLLRILDRLDSVYFRRTLVLLQEGAKCFATAPRYNRGCHRHAGFFATAWLYASHAQGKTRRI